MDKWWNQLSMLRLPTKPDLSPDCLNLHSEEAAKWVAKEHNAVVSEMQAKLEALANYKPGEPTFSASVTTGDTIPQCRPKVCPTCGRCPTCGHQPTPNDWLYPQPYYVPYPQPATPVWPWLWSVTY